MRRALPRELALQHIRAEDRRPLLVVRECGFCRGTEDALLSRRLDNEKTLIYAKWFRCVKLPNHVLEADHPFRLLFPESEPPHLFLCRYDGSEVVALDGQQTQSELWSAMERLIGLEYERDPERATRDYRRLLNEYDVLDGLESETRHQYEEELDENGPRSGRARKLAGKLTQLQARRAKAEGSEAAILDLGLRPLPSPDGGEAADHEAEADAGSDRR